MSDHSQHPERAGFALAFKVGAVVLLLATAYVATMWWQDRLLGRRIDALRDESAHQAMAHLDGLVTLESRSISTFSISYSYWDELVSALEKPDQGWFHLNIDQALSDYSLDAAFILAPDGTVVYAVGPASAGLGSTIGSLDIPGMLKARTGRFSLAALGTIVDLAYGTIHPTVDTARVSQPHGILIGVRLWSGKRIGAISRLFGGSVTLGGGPERSDDTVIVIRHPLQGPRGDPVAEMVAIRTIPALDALMLQGNQHALLSAGFGLAALLILAITGILLIGLPLRRLAASVRHDDLAIAQRIGRRRDELGSVARAVEGALEQRQHLAKEIEHRKLLTEHLSEANDLLMAQLREREETEAALRQAEMRNSLALQGGNLSLWDLVIAEDRWQLDRTWFALLGVTLDPSVRDAEAWHAVVDPADWPALQERLAPITGGTQDTMEVTIRIRRDDGGRVWIMARGTVVERAEDGRPTRVSGTMLDVTRWRELEEQLRQSQKMESIGQLAAGIAHEINTPIQFIGDNARFTSDSFASLLTLHEQYRTAMATHPDPEVRRAVAEAEGNADLDFLRNEIPRAIAQTLEGVDRVATIVRAMKEFSHPGGTGLVPTDLNHLVDNAIVISRNTWRYVAELDFQADRSLPAVPLATGDFNQALLNILVNAAQAIEDAQRSGAAAPGHIRIATSRDGDHAVLSISDTGCGMPPEVRDRIYDPFFTTKEVGRGTGQGLTITRTVIVDRHKGSIHCESEPGKGTSFTIRIPFTAPG